MKKSTVTTVTFKKEGEGKNGKWYLFHIALENGDAGEVFTNSNPPTEFSQGAELEYEIKDDTYQGITKKKITIPKKGGGRGGFGGKGFDSKGANRRVALECATRLVVAGVIQKDHIYDSAEKMTNWLSK